MKLNREQNASLPMFRFNVQIANENTEKKKRHGKSRRVDILYFETFGLLKIR